MLSYLPVTDFDLIDPQQAVEWDHPLNQGLLGWWPNFAPLDGGQYQYDVARRSDAALTNGPAWVAGPNGLAAVLYDGSNDYASVSLDLSAYSALTLAFWLWWDAYANDDHMALEYTADGVANSGFYVDPNQSAGVAEVATGPAVSVGTWRFTRPSAAAWHHYVCAFDRSVSTGLTGVYIDGQLVTRTGGSSGTPGGNFANSTLYVMSRAGSSLFGAGRMGDFRVTAGRAVGDAEAFALYDQSRRGHPDTLRRFSPVSYFLGSAPAGTTFQPAWAAGCNQFFGGGVISC